LTAFDNGFTDRLDPARDRRSYDCPGRSAFASHSEILRPLLQRSQNASVFEQGWASLSLGTAHRYHSFMRDPWRTSSPLKPDLRFSVHTGGDGGVCGPQIIVCSTRGTGPNPGRRTLAAATLEAANGMTSHSKTCYADIVKCFARRWRRDADFSNASGDFANAHDRRRSIHNRPARPPPEILAPCWIKPKRQSTSGAVRGREASLAP
jgi:hypothetical protein